MGKAGKTGKDKQMRSVAKDSSGKRSSGVALYKMPLKAVLRSWPDENGCMLLTNKRTPAEHFTAATLAELLTSESSQGSNVPALGVSMAAASMESCLAALAVMPKAEDKKFKQTGLPAAQKLLASLSKSLAVANIGNRACADPATSTKHIANLLKKLGEKEGLTQRLKEFAHLADTGSRLYAGAMAGLELATLAARPKAWADKLSNQNKVDRPLKTFVNTGSLTELAEGVANLNAARLTPQKRRTFADSSDDEKKQACGNESGEESASGCSQPAGPVSEESCSEDKRSKKKRKEKKSKDERKRDKAMLTLEDEEEEASDEEGGAPDVHLSWPGARALGLV